MTKTLYCSFCGKSRDEVRQLIAGPNAYICNECVQLSSSIVDTSRTRIPAAADEPPTASEIREALDSQIGGQERVKRALSEALHRHLQGSQRPAIEDATVTPSPRILLCGPGLERSAVARGLFRCVGPPSAAIDVGTLIESGRDRDAGQVILGRLLRAAHYNIESTQRGVIYIDDLDQLGRLALAGPEDLSALARRIQKGIAALMAGPAAQVPTDADTIMTIDPRRIMIICAGTWFDMAALTAAGGPGSGEASPAAGARPGGPPGLGAAERDALVAAGLLPELVRQFTLLAATEADDPFDRPAS